MVKGPNELITGLVGEVTESVTEEMSAISVGSGTQHVFATPALSALMEKTAYTSVIDYLDTETCSVGSRTVLEHLAPTPVGSTVKCITKLVKIEGRSLTFSFSVTDAAGEIAKGTHERVIVNVEKFLDRAAKRMIK
ncbi:MAG TPA: thioesterase family protein [Candidatus Methanomethylophilaceae archaeon]|nr:thioesterase family protein [Candidatus Methanomethylophilaceae archaeon]